MPQESTDVRNRWRSLVFLANLNVAERDTLFCCRRLTFFSIHTPFYPVVTEKLEGWDRIVAAADSGEEHLDVLIDVLNEYYKNTERRRKVQVGTSDGQSRFGGAVHDDSGVSLARLPSTEFFQRSHITWMNRPDEHEPVRALNDIPYRFRRHCCTSTYNFE